MWFSSGIKFLILGSNAVKALVGTNSLMDPNHPLHIEGTEGTTLFLGVDGTGSRRLLFSLKQLQYIQYYIREMGLVKGRLSEVDNSWIPLPGAAHLMPASAFVELDPINLATSAALKNQIRHLSKFNKALHNPRAHPVPKKPKLVKTIEAVIAEDNNLETANNVKEQGDTSVFREQQVEADSHVDHGNTIFFHAQQALTIASTGGTPAMIRDSPGGPTYRAAIGRGLFLALDITTWEFDEDIVLEFGYAAAWFERKVDFDEDGTLRAARTASDQDETESEMVLRKDRGHWTVQEHLNVHRNGLVKPDNRGHYLFGDSLPIQAKHFNGAVLGMVNDLRRRAGDGSSAVVYAIVHSPDASLAELGKVGLDTSSWATIISPITKRPAYTDPRALTTIVLFDTAELFAAIEFDPAENKDIDVPRTTDKGLEEVGMIMFGSDADKAPTRLGNAGNDAFYNLEAFLAMASGPPLDVLRVDYRLSQQSSPDTPSMPTEPVKTDVETAPVHSETELATSHKPSLTSAPLIAARQPEPVERKELSADYKAQADAIAAEFVKSSGQAANDATLGSPPVSDSDSDSEADEEMDIKGVFFGDVELDDPDQAYV